MRILSSGLLLGSGVVVAVYGVRLQETSFEVNRFIILGLALMSLGLFALRVNMKSDDKKIPSTYIPAEYKSDH